MLRDSTEQNRETEQRQRRKGYEKKQEMLLSDSLTKFGNLPALIASLIEF